MDSFQLQHRQAASLIRNLVRRFPGLLDFETPVDGADLVEWFTNELRLRPSLLPLAEMGLLDAMADREADKVDDAVSRLEQ